MIATTCELLWLKLLVQYLGIAHPHPNQALLWSSSCSSRSWQSIFHEHTKHIEIDCQLLSQKLHSKVISTSLMFALVNNLQISSPRPWVMISSIDYLASWALPNFMRQLEGEYYNILIFSLTYTVSRHEYSIIVFPSLPFANCISMFSCMNHGIYL